MDRRNLIRIGELARAANVSQRTIDYYTTIGLLEPVQRTDTNYRLYSHETIERIKRINQLKQEKYSLEEIKQYFSQLSKVIAEHDIAARLTELQLHMEKLEREAKELQPMIDKLKAKHTSSLFNRLATQSAACVEVLLTFIDKGNNHFMM
ncbi:MerR family transcriptional regulator [Paenibacillus profundus]|uniref:MerR family transcriptional regulator n=1 Tax=Paenibacillus profundus TaxID=1173085 RepID=A0ABS8YGB4_9BACL|nr:MULTISPECIES: MerR family transcriptional regulator [Paenibacillus]MCE5171028.1 MerR family transcriptional regulator [Paenibacillus profundus]MCM3340380.1 MerR family transcriptional regulator [Paenibacillus sp. MER TA 81-3]